jgi:hypothetical protein
MRPPQDEVVALRSDDLDISVLPGKGGGIYAITDCATGIDVLFKTPWGWRQPDRPSAGDSQQQWLDRYPGDWQQLVSNAGSERRCSGVLRGSHGEAALIGWDLLEQGGSRLRLATELVTAPLRLERSLELAGLVLRIRGWVVNLAPAAVPVSWVQHPAFGAPFINERCRLYTGARTVTADSPCSGDAACRRFGSLLPGRAGCGRRARGPRYPARAGLRGEIDGAVEFGAESESEIEKKKKKRRSNGV